MRVVAAALTAAALVPAAACAQTAPPSLQLSRANGFVVIGSHFKPRERVTVSVLSRGVHVGTTIARAGAFRLDFGGLKLATCAPLRVIAVGARGSRAALSYPARVCIQPGPGPDGSAR